MFAFPLLLRLPVISTIFCTSPGLARRSILHNTAHLGISLSLGLFWALHICNLASFSSRPAGKVCSFAQPAYFDVAGGKSESDLKNWSGNWRMRSRSAVQGGGGQRHRGSCLTGHGRARHETQCLTPQFYVGRFMLEGPAQWAHPKMAHGHIYIYIFICV